MKLVVHGTNWIGDAVMSIPALKTLRQMLPDAEITLYSRRWASEVFEDCGFLDRVLVPEADTSGIFGPVRESRLWKKQAFDAAVLFPNSFGTALIAKLAGTPIRIGFANEGRGMLLTEAVPVPDWRSEKHETYYYLELVKWASELLDAEFPSENEIDTSLRVSTERRRKASAILSNAGVSENTLVVGLGVGSQNSNAKRWIPSHFGQLADMINEQYDAGVVLIGSDSEIATAHEVTGATGADIVDLTGKTSVGEAVGVLAEIDLFVSNDMGLAHLASAVGTQTITIFGPTNPTTTSPWKAEVVRRDDIECAPCHLRECPIDHRCMTRIGATDVFEIVQRKIAESSRR
ncbi:MAG: lipopolysaccharide heptosyltransferase II [Pyrinomonadaceae bacterium]|nr:lipopolysaccharide heptosyltransferase II [Pyrinomonadaceae bacterium]